jgi:class 3 adenylate cyclase
VTDSQKFCGECGRDLRVAQPAPPAESERKQVTVLFADVARSMDLAEQFDPDAWTQIISGLFRVASESVRRYGGTVDKFTGDGLMALFGAPIAQEDHASRAAHAALALIAAAKDYAIKVHGEHGADLHVRVGLNSGEVVAGEVGESGFTAVGHTVGLAQRMESLADLDTVRLSEHTARLLSAGFALRDLGAVAVRGATDPLHTFALDAATGGAHRRAGTARLVGRAAEWATLLASLGAADAGRAEVIGIVGEAGAGKSRLTDELARVAADRDIVVRRTAGVSHATSVPLLPIQILFRDYFGLRDAESSADARDRIADRLLKLDPGLDGDLPLLFDFLEVRDPDRPGPHLGLETGRRRVLETIRRITRARSEQVTLLLVLEDLHWFDPASIAFLDQWLPSFPGSRTLVVTNFRPEFRAPWANRSFYRQVPLGALSTPAVTDLVTDLLGPDASTAALSVDLAERAGGNPFFVEEILRGWIEDGTLVGRPGQYRLARRASALRIPSSVQTVLSGRIDRLAVRSKSVLQSAAVIGRTFTTPVLSQVTGLPPDDLADALLDLCAAELVQAGEAGEYRFWHPLTQEVAYGSLLNATRRRHHRAVAEALIASAPGRQDEIASLVATHFEAADDHLETARWQVRAAARGARVDVQDAVHRLQSAIQHSALASGDTEAAVVGIRARSLLLRVSGRAGLDTGEAEKHVAEARRAAEGLGDPVVLTHLEMATGIFRYFTGSHGSASAEFADARRYADLAGDPDLRAWTYGVGATAHSSVGPLGEGRRLLAQARALRSSDPDAGMRPTRSSPELALPNRAEVDDTLLLIGGAIELSAGDLGSARSQLLAAREAYRIRPVSDWLVWTLALLATLADCTGIGSDCDLARQVLDEAHRLADESGSTLAKVKACQATALVAMADGRPDEAAIALTRGMTLARANRAGLNDEASFLTNLARAHLMSGDTDRARVFASEAVSTASRQGARVVEAMAQGVRARVLRTAARADADLAEAGAVIAQGIALAESVGANTWAAFLAEERARLDDGDFAAVAAGYEAIGAIGHAARIRAEFAG